ncbi:uncharacterized protein B0I36DRAFT_296115 [Microdochium trichocladiopsis]|uniref:Fe2OG dioxygenase domain-containing protein n=1 Tax=Microdochium trichocladiopsis TaxID=1682393 RepID=A0A9P9BK01_9PEZI|nr:uncharacterized protein B0I36DRAFT_296115 [Microdochium trichocladiopsis]KAH7020729.1 hypothetical protein B0I36DRAFT_296115 [Microdochium trichocladiopsis]
MSTATETIAQPLAAASTAAAAEITLHTNQDDEFPVIDFGNLARDPEGTAAQIFEAACRWGFLVLKGHGIPKKDVDAMFALSAEFFDQPSEIKAEKWMNQKQQGYDFKDWRDVPKRTQAEAFRSQCRNLSESLLQTFARAMDLAPDFFTSAHSPDKDPGNVLRLIRYPALPAPADPRFPRLGEHTDWGTLTLLFARTPGLEVRPPGDRGWVPAPVVEDAVIVNIADGLALWSGKALKSTMHRLSWDSLPYDMHRYSIAYFVNANADAPLKMLKGEVGSGGKYVEAPTEFAATFGDYQAVRMRMIHEKFNTEGTEEDLKVDPAFVDMVKNIGVAHGTGVTFDGKGLEQ